MIKLTSFLLNRELTTDMMKQCIWVVQVVLVMMFCATQAKKQQSAYTALTKGQSVRGKTAVEFNTRSSVECSLRLVVMNLNVKVSHK